MPGIPFCTGRIYRLFSTFFTSLINHISFLVFEGDPAFHVLAIGAGDFIYNVYKLRDFMRLPIGVPDRLFRHYIAITGSVVF